MNESSAKSGMIEETTRITALDFLKITLVILVIISHSALPYFIGPNGVWYFHSKTYNINFFTPMNFSFNAFIINTFFFIAGILSYYSLQRHSISNFIESRTKRLLIPLILGFLFIIPPLQYYVYLNYEPVSTHVSFFNYLFSYWFGLSPKPANWVGHYPDMNLGHLWFLEHLIIYSLLLAGIFFLIKRTNFTINFNFYFFVIIIILTTFITTYIMKLFHPVTEMSSLLGFIQVDYTHVPENFILFFGGVYFAKADYLSQIGNLSRKIFFSIGTFLALLPFIIYYFIPIYDNLFKILDFFVLWETLTAVTFAIGSVTYLSSIMKKEHSVIKKLGGLSYIMYVIHVIFVVFLQIVVESILNTAIIKFAVVSIGSILLTLIFSFIFLFVKDSIFKLMKVNPIRS